MNQNWLCGNCGVDCEDDFENCWNCGTGRDGEPADPDFERDDMDPDALRVLRSKKLRCQRCDAQMHFVGTKKFHEGGPLATLLAGDLFLNRERYDAYACEQCGKLEFFLEARRP